MAGDWLKMRHDLPDDPAVLTLASACGIARQHVVGSLHAVWSWFDKHSRDGRAPNLTPDFIDELAGVENFAENLQKVGWLRVTSNAISIPRFERHMSQGAKQRVLTANRVAKHRKRRCNAGGVTKSLPEKRREEKNTSPPKPPTQSPAPQPPGARPGEGGGGDFGLREAEKIGAGAAHGEAPGEAANVAEARRLLEQHPFPSNDRLGAAAVRQISQHGSALVRHVLAVAERSRWGPGMVAREFQDPERLAMYRQEVADLEHERRTADERRAAAAREREYRQELEDWRNSRRAWAARTFDALPEADRAAMLVEGQQRLRPEEQHLLRKGHVGWCNRTTPLFVALLAEHGLQFGEPEPLPLEPEPDQRIHRPKSQEREPATPEVAGAMECVT